MFSLDNHFIDSNVILGFVIDWDGLKSKCRKYFQNACNRYASENVYDECESVLSDVKDWVLKFLHAISKEHPIISSYFKKDLDVLIEKTATQHSNSMREYQKIVDVLRSFSNHHQIELRNIMTGNNPYKPFRKTVTNAFKDSRRNFISVFNHLITKSEKHPFSLGLKYKSHILKRQIHNTDFKILLDAYHFSDNYLTEQMAFITFDNGIKDVRLSIEQEFGFKVFMPP